MTVERWLCIGIALLGIGDILQNSELKELATKNQEAAASIQSLHADLRKLLRELEIDQTPPELLPTPEPEADLFDEWDSRT